MNKDELSAQATLKTSIFLCAQERGHAISAVSWALQKLLTAYETSECEAPQIQKMIDVFIAWQGDERVEQLKNIEREYMNEAARLTALLSGDNR